MSLKKQYLKSKPACKVTFKLPAEATKSARKVHLVGEFNEWNTSATPMKKLKDGAFTTTVTLKRGREYQFRYLVDGKIWENDWAADRYVPASGGPWDNSVVVV